MDIFSNLSVYLDIAIILIPVLIFIFLVLKFVFPRHPKLGIGLALGGGLLGAFFIHRKIKKAFDVEKKIAEFSENMDQFKKVQKGRQEAVLANKQVIEGLRKKREKLAKKGDKFKTERDLIDAELADREKLNKQLISNAENFLKNSERRSAARKALLGRMGATAVGPGEEINAPQEDIANRGTRDVPKIELNGYSLQEG